MKKWLIVLALLVLPAPGFAQAVPGCSADGFLRDPQGYVWNLLNRAPGQPAGDWVQVLRASGLPAGPGPFQKAGTAFYGITQQIGANDTYRGQVFLPTAVGDELGFFTHTILLLANAPGGDCAASPSACVWAWIDRGGPPYEPRQCAAVTPPHQVPPAEDDGPTPPTPSEPPAPPATIAIDYDKIRAIVEASEHRVIDAVNEPGWFVKVMKHPITIGIETFIAGYVANAQWGK